MQQEIYYATGNAGKFEEVKQYMEQYAPQIAIKQFDVDIDEIQSLDQQVVAIDKAKKAYALLKKPLLVDDGGIFLEAYNNFPGTFSKFVFQGIGFDGFFKLTEHNNKAAFILELVYIDDKIMQNFQGKCEGTIIKPQDLASHPKLPFTAIFKPNGSTKTLAELRNTPEFIKYSFRQQALQKFLNWHTS